MIKKYKASDFRKECIKRKIIDGNDSVSKYLRTNDIVSAWREAHLFWSRSDIEALFEILFETFGVTKIFELLFADLDLSDFSWTTFYMNFHNTGIILPRNCKIIPASFITWNNEVNALYIPDSVKSIDLEAFRTCLACKSIDHFDFFLESDDPAIIQQLNAAINNAMIFAGDISVNVHTAVKMKDLNSMEASFYE